MDNKSFLLELSYTTKYKFKKNIVIKNYPEDYKTKNVEKYYRELAKINFNKINYFDMNNFDFVQFAPGKVWMLHKSRKINYADAIPIFMNIIFDIDYFKNVKNFVQVDLSFTNREFEWVKNQITNYENTFKNTFKNIFKRNNIKMKSIYNPFYDFCDKNYKYRELISILFDKILVKEKQDLIYMNTVLPLSLKKSISFYIEYLSSISAIIYIYYILSVQKVKGSFIIQYSSFDTSLSRDHLRIFKNYYEKVYIFTYPLYGSNITYLIGKNFLGITKNELNIFKNIYEDMDTKRYIQNQQYVNIFDTLIRKKNYVSKHISNFDSNDFLHKIVDYEATDKMQDKDLDLQLDEYNKKVYLFMIKMQKLYNIK